MDKKRRENKTSKYDENENDWLALMSPVMDYEVCGITYKKFNFLENIGQGHFEYYMFDGLYLGVTDLELASDLKISVTNYIDTFELSFLIEGEQIIQVSGSANDFVYESQESYLMNISALKTQITYHKSKRFKEVKIRLNTAFMKKHHIDEANLLENYTLQKPKENFLKPLCARTQDILSEILADTRSGLLKRLFLESKTLELIALQLDSKNNIKSTPTLQTDNLLKKLYKIQHIITTNLSVQYSIQELAREVGLNDFALKKEFKRVFNQTLFEYASQTRMTKAKKLLDHTTKPIYEISEMVGYKNATHFSAAFKKLEGVTPKKYRDTKK